MPSNDTFEHKADVPDSSTAHQQSPTLASADPFSNLPSLRIEDASSQPSAIQTAKTDLGLSNQPQTSSSLLDDAQAPAARNAADAPVAMPGLLEHETATPADQSSLLAADVSPPPEHDSTPAAAQLSSSSDASAIPILAQPAENDDSRQDSLLDDLDTLSVEDDDCADDVELLSGTLQQPGQTSGLHDQRPGVHHASGLSPQSPPVSKELQRQQQPQQQQTQQQQPQQQQPQQQQQRQPLHHQQAKHNLQQTAAEPHTTDAASTADQDISGPLSDAVQGQTDQSDLLAMASLRTSAQPPQDNADELDATAAADTMQAEQDQLHETDERAEQQAVELLPHEQAMAQAEAAERKLLTGLNCCHSQFKSLVAACIVLLLALC